MKNIQENFIAFKSSIPDSVNLIAVSKTKPQDAILAIHQTGHLDFGENYVQELIEKYESLPKEIQWHFIGHLQSNKVKYIAPFVYLIHGVDSLKLLKEIDKQGKKNNRIISCLLQVHIADEETKFGFSQEEIKSLLTSSDLNGISSIRIKGVMGMASNTTDETKIRQEFKNLKKVYDFLNTVNHPIIDAQYLSMGMSGDYKIAMEERSNMIRIGSLLFGERNYQK